MSKWIAEFDLEDGDTMPEHMDLEYKGAKLDFHCRPMWIPCKERLPKKDGSYLVSGKWGSGKEAVGDCEYKVHDGYFRTAWNFHVLAWKNLPEPYREDGNEQ